MQEREHYPHMEHDAWRKRIEKGLTAESLSQADADLIYNYLEYKNVRDNISSKRKLKIAQHLINFVRLWSKTSYLELTPGIWINAASRIISSTYKANTKHDYIVIVKAFLHWGIKKKHISKLSAEDIDEVGTPNQQAITKAPEDLLNDNDIYKILLHPLTDPMMGALAALLYWTGARIGEAMNLRWKDVVFADQLLQIRITDTKSGIQRYAPCCEALEFVSVWRSKYPDINGGPTGNNFVFLSRKRDGSWEPMSVSNARKRIGHIGNVVLNRHIYPHLFRASDITNSSEKGVPDSVNKEIHWGNQSTTRLKTYLLLKNSQVDAAMYKRAGIERVEEEKENTGPIQCVHCRTINVPHSSYCRYCGMPLTRNAREKQQLLREAAAAAKSERSFTEMRKDAASYLGISEEELSELLGL